MTSIARSASSRPSATIFNGACLSATASTSGTSLVDPANAEVSVKRQLELLGIPRSSYYYRPRRRRRSLEGDDRERAMRVVDEVHLEMPYAGCRKIREELRRRTEGKIDVSRRCVAGLMEEMNVRQLCPKPNLSRPAKRAQVPEGAGPVARAASGGGVDIESLAWDVINGDYGNGEERRRRLGANYSAVQQRVNEILS